MLDSRGMIEDSQVKDTYFFSMALESEDLVKSFREDGFRLRSFNKRD